MKNMEYDLHGGIGNKINNLLNGLLSGARRFNWIIDEYSGASWEDLFSPWPSWFEVTNTSKRSPSARYDWFFRREPQREEAAGYLRMLVPSTEVSKHILDIPKGMVGHSVRLHHGKQPKPYPPFLIGGEGFLATDCATMRQMNPHLLQSGAISGRSDLDTSLRNREGTVRSTADWFTLMRCESLVNHGRKFSGFTRPHSTFLDAHRILGLRIDEGVSV
jgi:hypothetical protein